MHVTVIVILRGLEEFERGLQKSKIAGGVFIYLLFGPRHEIPISDNRFFSNKLTETAKWSKKYSRFFFIIMVGLVRP